MDSLHGTGKVWLLAVLWFLGLALIALAFVPGPPPNSNVDWPSPSRFVMWGLCPLLVALVWMYWDRKRQQLTPDQKAEQLLFEVARRYRRTRSLDAIAEEYRAAGASDFTLQLIRSAPQAMKARAEQKMRLGGQLLATGVLVTIGTWWLSRVLGFSHYEVAVGAFGGGIGFIIDGLRQRRAFEN